MSDRGSTDDHIRVSVTHEQVRELAGALAQLSIAVRETKVVKLDTDRSARLDRSVVLVRKWDDVFRKREELRRMEADL